MLHEFCTRFTAKIRRLGYDPHTADCRLLFLIRCMTVVCAIMGVLNVPEPAWWESGRQPVNTAAGLPNHLLTSEPSAAFGIQRLPSA